MRVIRLLVEKLLNNRHHSDTLFCQDSYAPIIRSTGKWSIWCQVYLITLSIKCHSVEIFLAKRYVAIIFCGYQHRSAASQLLHLQRNWSHQGFQNTDHCLWSCRNWHHNFQYPRSHQNQNLQAFQPEPNPAWWTRPKIKKCIPGRNEAAITGFILAHLLQHAQPGQHQNKS